MTDSVTLLAVLIALLLGVAAGKAWERYKLRDGHWIDRRRFRESPHYLQGLNFLIARQLDLAIEELGKSVELYRDAADIQIVLGNLYREKGQVGRAIQIHQQVLQRPRITRYEHASVLLCLGLDYMQGGFVDRAIEAFTEVLRLEPDNRHALANLEKLYGDQHQWGEAYKIRTRLAEVAPAGQQSRHQGILAFLENELGMQALKASDPAEAQRRFQAAIELDPTVAPAYLNLGDLQRSAGDVTGAARTWERLVELVPDRAWTTFDRLSAAYRELGDADRFDALCRRLMAANVQDWRSRLALAASLAGRGQPSEAFELLLEALAINPHAISVHREMWRTLAGLGYEPRLVDRYVSESRDAIFYQDPHLCLRCHYRSTELLWQCPHCHEWNTFVEERLTPARDHVASEVEPVA
jgi:lipopolysaccharide biosynthesis regulator YciM